MKNEISLERRAFAWSRKGKIISGIEGALLMGTIAALIPLIMSPLLAEPPTNSTSNMPPFPTVAVAVFCGIFGALWGALILSTGCFSFFSHKLFPPSESCIAAYKEARKEYLLEQKEKRCNSVQEIDKELESLA